jgi:hypothetical protein
MATQIYMLSIVVISSKRDFTDKNVDMVYTWKCICDIKRDALIKEMKAGT